MEDQVMSSSSSSTPKQEKLKDILVAMEESNDSSSTPKQEKLKGILVATEESNDSSSTPKQEKLKGILVAMEESNEKATENSHLKLGSPQNVISESRIESPSFGVVPRGKEIMKFYPSKSNQIYTCNFCKKEFSSCQALGGHQNAHKQERKWDKKRKEMEDNFPGLAFMDPYYLDKPHIVLGGYSQDALSNENHLGFTLDPFKRIVYPSSNGLTGGNMNIVPRVAPTRFFTGNTSTNGSASRVPNLLPSYNNMGPPFRRDNPGFPLQTATISRDFSSQEDVLREENFISKVGIRNVVEIDDDDDQPESGGVNLSLSL